MERLETQFKKYSKEIDMLEKENAVLEKKLKDHRPSVMAKLEHAKEKQEIQFLCQF